MMSVIFWLQQVCFLERLGEYILLIYMNSVLHLGLIIICPKTKRYMMRLK